MDARRHWRRKRIALLGEILAYLATVFLLVLIVQAIAAVLIGRTWGVIPFESRCSNNGISCGILSGLAMPLLTVAAASSVFIFFRLTRVRRRYRGVAVDTPRKLVPTAGRILGRVVGRDELCQVIINNIFDWDIRRAHVIVGGVGAGKTAVLVRLTRMLALAGATPVPIMLREAQTESDLDFRELAHKKFTATASTWLINEAEGERAWRQLCRDYKIVVLADGLEEALINNDERNNLIRLAIERANTQKLPLVIASRPHDPLRYMEAAIIELEPLSEEAALSYMREDGNSRDREDRLDWIIETAQVAEEPLYLQITRQLHKEGLLDYISPSPGSKPLETRGADRTEMRLHLMETWLQALIDGRFPPGVSMSHDDRRAAVEGAAALACIGLKTDSVDVKFADLLGSLPEQKKRSATEDDTGDEDNADGGTSRRGIKLHKLRRAEPHPLIMKRVHEQLGRIPFDIQVAAGRAEQLGLVEVRGDGLRFPHSVLQAFLGSRMMSAALSDDSYCNEAAQKPGREFLISVVMYYRSQDRQELKGQGGGSHTAAGQVMSPSQDAAAGLDPDVKFILNDLLLPSARVQDINTKKLDIYAAALEIDSASGGWRHPHIAQTLCQNWPPTTTTNDRALEEAKIGVVRRFGEALRKVSGEPHADGERVRPEARMEAEQSDGQRTRRNPVTPAYEQLYEIGIKEQSYSVRIAVAQEIGAGGDQAYRILKDRFARVKARLEKGPEERIKIADDDKAREYWREEILCAWLAPLLAGSASSTAQTAGESGANASAADKGESPRTILNALLGQVGGERSQQGKRYSLEMALAQGFKYAANRRRHHPGVKPGAGSQLAEQAMEMLKRSTFWFTQLTLLHALCLWALPEDENTEPPSHGHGSEPEAIVQHWCAIAGSEHGGGGEQAGTRRHPFVEEASRLAIRALEEERPDKYLWIDESGVLGIVGSHGEGPQARRKHHLWIPASTGWSVLDASAQRLVADVLLLLNLAERGDRPEDHDRRLGFTARPDLPPCLTEDRSYLYLDRPAGVVDAGAPGQACRDDCFFQLCPYPPWGGPSYRVELSESFCRNQQADLKTRGLPEAPWQYMPTTDLKDSWGKMADRSRIGHPVDDT